MADRTFDELNDPDVEAPGGTQATHSASARGKRATRGKGPRVQVPERVHRAVDAGKAYVRANDIGDMKADLEREIREHPLKSIAIALAAGYLLSKLVD